MDVHGKKLLKDAIFKTPCVVIIFDKAPRFREAKSSFGCKQMRRTEGRERVGGKAGTRAGCCTSIIRDALGPTLRSHSKVEVQT